MALDIGELLKIKQQLGFFGAGGGQRSTGEQIGGALTSLGTGLSAAGKGIETGADIAKKLFEAQKLKNEITRIGEYQNPRIPTVEQQAALDQVFSNKQSAQMGQVAGIGANPTISAPTPLETPPDLRGQFAQDKGYSADTPTDIALTIEKLKASGEVTPKVMAQIMAAQKRAETMAEGMGNRQNNTFGQQDKLANQTHTIELRKEFINRPEVKDYVTINTQVKSMNALLKSALAGNQKNQLALDQGLITMFNKLTDPNSVVRESEYARTPENIPMINRISGSIDKLKAGGAGLTNEDREALVLGAKIIGNERGKVFNDVRNQYDGLANNTGINSQSVTGTLPVFGGYDLEPVQPKQKQYNIGDVETTPGGQKATYVGNGKWRTQ